MCELLVGLPDVNVIEVTDDARLRVHLETRQPRAACPACGSPVMVKDRDTVELTDLPCYGRPAILAWRKIRRYAMDCGWRPRYERSIAGCGGRPALLETAR